MICHPLTQPGSAPTHPVSGSAAPDRAPPQPCTRANDGDLHLRPGTARPSQQRRRMGAALGGSAAACLRRALGVVRFDASDPPPLPDVDPTAALLGSLVPPGDGPRQRMALAVAGEVVVALP